jgi:hypothetical protein
MGQVSYHVSTTDIQVLLFVLVTLVWLVVFFWPLLSKSAVAWRKGELLALAADRLKFFGSGMMPLHNAARFVYDRVRGTALGKFVERNFDDPDRVLRVLAMYIAGTSVPLFGKRPAGASLVEFDKEMLKKGTFRAAGSEFCVHGKHVPEFTDMSMRKRDLPTAISQIKALSNALPNQDGYI